jgi:hypothetical protein
VGAGIGEVADALPVPHQPHGRRTRHLFPSHAGPVAATRARETG